MDFVPALRVSLLDVVLAGAVPAFADRIDTDLESLTLADPTPLGDDLLDPTLAEIKADVSSRVGEADGVHCSQDAAYWIEKTT